MNDTDFMRPLARVYLVGSAVCMLGGGAVGLLAANESWRTVGAGFCIGGTPFALFLAGSVWLMDRIMG